MHCKHCGEMIDSDSRFCVKCGKLITIISTQDETSSFGGGKIKKPQQRWSWGAFGLGWIYFAGMKYKYYGWLFLLSIVVNGLSKNQDMATSIVAGILWLGIIIVFGIKGRTIAWESRKWKDEKEFIDTQKRWDIWGIIIFIIIQSLLYFIPLE